jgi:hypothetical protein
MGWFARMNTPHHEATKLLPSSSDEESLQFPVDDVDGGDVGMDLSNAVNMIQGISSPQPNESKDVSSVSSNTPKGTPKKASPLRISTDLSDFPCTDIPSLDEGISMHFWMNLRPSECLSCL